MVYSISEPFIVDISDFKQVRISQRINTHGNLAVDIRFWAKFPNQTEWCPTKSGCLIEIAKWKQLLPEIQRLIGP